MPWQSAARGALLRPLHFGASTRPNAMIGVQNQLRHLCLAANVRQARPQLQRIPAVLSLSQSKSFATDTSLKPKKTKAKTGNKKPAKSSSTKKKPLTEKQKEAKELRQHKDHIKQLKQTALEVPKGRLENYFFIALHEKINEIKGQYPNQRDAVKAAAEMLKPVPNEAVRHKTLVAVVSELISQYRNTELRPRRTKPPIKLRMKIG
jgi:hypothetical protein